MEYHFADCILDTERHLLLRGGAPVPVEPQVFDLIHLLASAPGRLVSRDEIVEVIWQGRIVSDSAISARIAGARKALGDDGKRQAIIRTVARRGLKLVAEVTPNNEATAPDATSRPRRFSAPQRIRYTRTPEGNRIAYTLSGSGPPVMRSNSAIASDVDAEWRIDALRQGFDAISAHHTLLRFDPLGVGRSDRAGASVEREPLAEQMRIVADAADFGRFALYSESGGCLRAICFAARHPERVSRLAIVGGYVDGRLRRGATTTGEPIRGMMEAGWDTPRGGLASGYLLSYFPEGPLDSVREIVEMMQTSTPKDFALAQRDVNNVGTIADLLPLVRCPTLIIHGRSDAVHPLSAAQKLAAGIPGSELVVLETGNHFPLPGNAVWETYIETLLAFLGEQDNEAGREAQPHIPQE